MGNQPEKVEAANLERGVLPRALDALRRMTGIKARVVHYRPRAKTADLPDAVIELRAGGKAIRYAADIKHADRRATLGLVKNKHERYADPGLLVAHRVTREIAQACREADIQFIDTAGNAYLRAPGILVFVTGQQIPPDEIALAPRQGRAGAPTALRMLFAILCQPDLLNAPYREIKEAAGIALGAIGWIFFDLTQRGLMGGGGQKHARRLLEPQRLIDEWATNYPMRLRPKLHPMKFRAPTPGWWKQLDPTRYGAQWGGEVAADKLTGHLKPAACTLYMHPDDTGRRGLARLVADHRLRPDPQGDVEILDAFWRLPPDTVHPELVPPLLVYADLLATLDPRNLEAAKLIYARELAHVIR